MTWAKFEYTHKIISGGLLHQRGEITRFWKKKTHLAAAVVIRLAAVDHIWNAKKKRNDAKREKEKTTCRMIHDRLNEAQSTKKNNTRKPSKKSRKSWRGRKKCPVTLLFNLSTAVGRNDDDDILDVFFFFFHSAWKERELPSHDIISLDVKKMT